MKTIKIKNLQTTGDVYCGQTIGAGEYYQLQTQTEIDQFAIDQKVNQHLWTDPVKILISNGINDLSSVDGDLWLKGTIPPKIITEPSNSFEMQMVGVESECLINNTTIIDYKLQNYVGETYIYKYLWGGVCFGTNIEYGDYATFQIVDKDGVGVAAGWYTQAEFDAMSNLYVVKEYIRKFYIDPNVRMDFKSTAPGTLLVGLYLRCKYVAVNVGSSRGVYINYDVYTRDEG